MKRYDVYKQYSKGSMTLADAAANLGMTERDFKFRMTKWGNRLPTVLKLMDGVEQGAKNSKDVVEALGIQTRAANSLIGSFKVVRPLGEWRIERAAPKIKWDLHTKVAIDVIACSKTLTDAAIAGNISERQVRRVVAALIKQHCQMTYRDLSAMRVPDRCRIANEIEQNEQLDYANRQLLEAIEQGHTTVADEARKQVQYLEDLKRRR